MLLEFRNEEVGEITKQRHTNINPVAHLLHVSTFLLRFRDK